MYKEKDMELKIYRTRNRFLVELWQNGALWKAKYFSKEETIRLVKDGGIKWSIK